MEKNGTIFNENRKVEVVFEVVLKMCNYEDWADVYKLLTLFERVSLTNIFIGLQSYAPFYVC